MITIVDSGGANLASIRFAFARIGISTEVTADADRIAKAKKVVLPGVGSADRAMMNLRRRDLIECIRQLHQPVLGICLGMQLLFDGSAEGDIPALGVISGKVTRLDEGDSFARPNEVLTVPHMGWNSVRRNPQCESRLLDGIDEDAFFYFVHSFCAPVIPSSTTGVCRYGREFTAVIEQGNFMGTQFHPERSGAVGARLLRNFGEL